MADNANTKKLLAAVWFAAFALIASGLFFLHPPMAFAAVVLYVLLPGLSAGIAAYIWGGAILDSSVLKSYPDCLLRGLGITLAAYGIFSILFAVGVTVSEKLWNVRQLPSLVVMTITLGFVMVGPFMLLAGALAALSLRRLRDYAFGKNAIAGKRQ
ncbi:MAG TPA: hypothetical protein VKW06_16650 [Candidatus Angelobacter sp.]|nr:hypothetical protein [Candidatus Angelobacter sp.]